MRAACWVALLLLLPPTAAFAAAAFAWLAEMVNFPKKKNTHCKKCNKHESHAITWQVRTAESRAGGQQHGAVAARSAGALADSTRPLLHLCVPHSSRSCRRRPERPRPPLRVRR